MAPDDGRVAGALGTHARPGVFQYETFIDIFKKKHGFKISSYLPAVRCQIQYPLGVITLKTSNVLMFY